MSDGTTDFLNVQRRPWHPIRASLSWMLAINHSVGRVDRNMSQSVEMALKVQTEEVLTYVTLCNIHWRHTWQLSNSFFRSFMFVKNHLKVTKKKGNSTQIAGNKTTFADNGEIIFAHFFVRYFTSNINAAVHKHTYSWFDVFYWTWW